MIHDSNKRVFAIVGIGSSAGGPAALERLFLDLLATCPSHSFCRNTCQSFTRPLAERLSSVSKWPVKEAYHGCIAKEGEALIAPGGYNMEISRGGIVRLEGAPDCAITTPSINVMMRSIVRASGPKSVGVLLTGMLSDGVNGMKAIKDRSGVTIGQDEESSLVYGMPKAAFVAGVMDLVANTMDMPARITDAVEMFVARSLAIE
jgi:two-component system chemotaxis response regulator CheB